MRYKDQHGYIRIKCSNKSGFILEHRLMMEMKLGRRLESQEQVHHINKNRSDNRIENLRLYKNIGDHWYAERGIEVCPVLPEEVELLSESLLGA